MITLLNNRTICKYVNYYHYIQFGWKKKTIRANETVKEPKSTNNNKQHPFYHLFHTAKNNIRPPPLLTRKPQKIREPHVLARFSPHFLRFQRDSNRYCYTYVRRVISARVHAIGIRKRMKEKKRRAVHARITSFSRQRSNESLFFCTRIRVPR